MTENKYFGKYDGEKSIKQLSFDQMPLKQLPEPFLKWIDQNGQAVIMIFNERGVLKYVSHSIQSFLNIKPKQLLGQTWESIFTKPCKKFTEKNYSHSYNGLQRFKLSLEDDAGKRIWFNSVTSPLHYDNKTFYLASLTDITHTIELEELMMQSEKLSVAGQLAAGIAHEIRNPLTSLKGFLQLLAAGVDAKDSYYKIMIDEINKIENITSELLFISKPVNTYMQTESVKSMINEVFILLQSEARINSVKLMTDNILDLSILCNRTQVKQALINIIKNAIEAVEAQSTIMITMAVDHNDYVLIDIIDEGPGISQELVHKLSEPFYTTKQEGTGLGLMITQKIIDDHNGYM